MWFLNLIFLKNDKNFWEFQEIKKIKVINIIKPKVFKISSKFKSGSNTKSSTLNKIKIWIIQRLRVLHKCKTLQSFWPKTLQTCKRQKIVILSTLKVFIDWQRYRRRKEGNIWPLLLARVLQILKIHYLNATLNLLIQTSSPFLKCKKCIKRRQIRRLIPQG